MDGGKGYAATCRRLVLDDVVVGDGFEFVKNPYKMLWQKECWIDTRRVMTLFARLVSLKAVYCVGLSVRGSDALHIYARSNHIYYLFYFIILLCF